MDQFSRVAKKYVDKGLIAGLEWEIRHFNNVVSKDVYGYSDIENKTILKPGQIYRIYSMTKPIVSVAAIRLIEACKLSLYSTVQDFIPSFKYLRRLIEAKLQAVSSRNIYSEHGLEARIFPSAGQVCHAFMVS